MISYGVVPASVRDILQVPYLSTIWRSLPRNMTFFMRNFVSVINLIERLKDHAHDPTSFGSLPYPSMSSTPPHGPPPASPPHDSTPSIDPPTSPPHVSTPSMSDPPPPHIPPLPHGSTPSTSYPPPHVSTPSTYPHASPPHAPPSNDPPHPPPPPPLVSPFTNPCPSSPHVSSSTDPPPLPPHVSQAFDALDTMFTSGIVAQVDLDRETFDSVLMSTFIFYIIIDRPSTFSSRDTNASGSGGGPS
jgi:hypothetical protein